MMITDEQRDLLRDNVKAGVVFLDDRLPNWRKKIEPGNLHMRQTEYCILGQLFGRYHFGCKELEFQELEFDTSVDTAGMLGFNLPDWFWEMVSELDPDEGTEHYLIVFYDALTELWLEELDDTHKKIDLFV